MTININQVIINTLTEDRKIIKTNTRESYLLYPADGKVLKNIKTSEIFEGVVSVSLKREIEDYIEIDKPEEEIDEYLK